MKYTRDAPKTLPRGQWDSIDTGMQMMTWISQLPEQIEDAVSRWPNPKIKLSRPSGIVIVGMGGSAMAGDIAALAYPCGCPIVVNRSEQLPAWVDSSWLCIATSYSGNTHETLTCYNEAISRECRIVTMSSGGELERLGMEKAILHRSLQSGQPPRTAVGQAIAGLLWLLHSCDLMDDPRKNLLAAAGIMREQLSEGLASPNPWETVAGRLSHEICNRMALVVSAGPATAAATRWVQQLNENSKEAAFAAAVPEMLHNIIEGLDDFAAHDGALIILHDSEQTAMERKAMHFLEESYAQAGGAVRSLESRGKSWLERIFSLMYLGDQVSYLVALLRGVDPTPVERIGLLKSTLAER